MKEEGKKIKIRRLIAMLDDLHLRMTWESGAQRKTMGIQTSYESQMKFLVPQGKERACDKGTRLEEGSDL